MRLVSIGLLHETNTFASQPTTLDDFVLSSGEDPNFANDELAERSRNTETVLGGALERAAARGVDLEPLFHARAQPAGTVEQPAYERMKALFLQRLTEALPVDGVLLELHGAMVTETHDDAEGDVVACVREVVGPEVPVAMTLDLHANITRQMVDGSDVIIGYDTYPHCDMGDRGREALDLLVRRARGEIRPKMGFRQLPLLTMPPRQCTLAEPMESILGRLHALESEPSLLTATLSCGFPFADIHDAGTSVVVVTDGDWELAEAKAAEFGDYVFSRRAEFDCELTPVSEAIRIAGDEADGPVILADGSDNPGGGAPCDGTVILRELIGSGMSDAVVGILYDPETVAQAHDAGVGETIHAVLGGKTDDKHGPPLCTPAYVRVLGDGRFTYQGPMARGSRGNFGRMAVLIVGGVTVVLAERRNQLLDMEMLRCVGVEPTRQKLIAVKSAVHFRAHFGPIASRILDADTPGVHRPDFSELTYRKVRRPIYPLDTFQVMME